MKKHPLARIVASIVSAGLIACTGGHAASAQDWMALTKVGAPTWKPGDFQLFTAPASTQEEFFGVVDTLLPLEGPSANPYVPHQPPYDTELSTNAAAGGYASQSVFDSSDIVLQPNAVYFAYMMLPDPGITGSSRDFASGPVIPNSLFPISRNVDVYRNAVLVDGLAGVDGPFNVRGGDVPFDGTSHRANVTYVYHPWDDDLTAGVLGDYELRQQLRDVQGNGWDMVASFQVVPEPSAGFTLFGLSGASLLAWRRKRCWSSSFRPKATRTI